MRLQLEDEGGGCLLHDPDTGLYYHLQDLSFGGRHRRKTQARFHNQMERIHGKGSRIHARNRKRLNRINQDEGGGGGGGGGEDYSQPDYEQPDYEQPEDGGGDEGGDEGMNDGPIMSLIKKATKAIHHPKAAGNQIEKASGRFSGQLGKLMNPNAGVGSDKIEGAHSKEKNSLATMGLSAAAGFVLAKILK